jgi:hypothetical protein
LKPNFEQKRVDEISVVSIFRSKYPYGLAYHQPSDYWEDKIMMAASMFIPVPAPLFLERSIHLESPFAWKSESFHVMGRIKFFHDGMSPTVSFTASRISKALGYIPFVGSIIGGLRIFSGIIEYKHFNLTHLHILSNRSVKWIVRGILETIPFLGGIVCMIFRSSGDGFFLRPKET